MIHEISHGRYGVSVLITALTQADAEFEVMEFQADIPHARFGPIVPRCGDCWGACGLVMADDF